MCEPFVSNEIAAIKRRKTESAPVSLPFKILFKRTIWNTCLYSCAHLYPHNALINGLTDATRQTMWLLSFVLTEYANTTCVENWDVSTMCLPCEKSHVYIQSISVCNWYDGFIIFAS